MFGLQLTQPAALPIATPSHQAKLVPPSQRGIQGLGGQVSFPGLCGGVKLGPRLPFCLLLGLPPAWVPLLSHGGTWAPASTWAKAASGLLISRTRASWNSSAGKGLDCSQNLWVGRKSQPPTPRCPLGLGSGLPCDWDRSPLPARP